MLFVIIMRKRHVCIQFTSMAVNSIPNLRPIVVELWTRICYNPKRLCRLLTRNLILGMHLGNIAPKMVKDKCEQGKRDFVDILYSVTVESGTMHICRQTKVMTRLGVAVFAIFGHQSTNKIEIIHFWLLALNNFGKVFSFYFITNLVVFVVVLFISRWR